MKTTTAIANAILLIGGIYIGYLLSQIIVDVITKLLIGG